MTSSFKKLVKTIRFSLSKTKGRGWYSRLLMNNKSHYRMFCEGNKINAEIKSTWVLTLFLEEKKSKNISHFEL